jgi:hypothetical protein
VALVSAWRSWEVGDPRARQLSSDVSSQGKLLRCATVRTHRSAADDDPIVTLGCLIAKSRRAQAFRSHLNSGPALDCHVRLAPRKEPSAAWSLFLMLVLRHLAERLGIEVDNGWG